MAGLTKYLDLSSHQEPIDLDAIWAEGYRYLMLKATQGLSYHWPLMQQLAHAWHLKGGRVGYYHWLLNNVSGTDQFNFFMKYVAPVWAPGDWLMGDFEDLENHYSVSDGQVAQMLSDFIALCRHIGKTDLYTGNWYIADKPKCIAYLRDNKIPVVMSDYGVSAGKPRNPYGLTYSAHQYTSTGRSAGCDGGNSNVDVNVWLVEPVIGTPAQPTGITPPVVVTPVGEEEDMQPFFVQATDEDKAVYLYTDSKVIKCVDAEAAIMADRFGIPAKPKSSASTARIMVESRIMAREAGVR